MFPSISAVPARSILLPVLMIILAAILFPPNGEAQEPSRENGAFQPDDPLVAFARRWDVNGDRVYTCGECELFMKRIFYRADRNHDDLIKGNELAAVIAADKIFSDASFAYFDTNNDRQITRAEFIGHPNPFFILYDTNRDCQVTATELDRK